MKITTFDDFDTELVGVGQTTNQSSSLRKEAIFENAGHTRKEEKRIAKALREQKNASKGKVASHSEEKSLKKTPKQKTISKRLRSREEKHEIYQEQLEDFTLEEKDSSVQMTPSQKESIHKQLDQRGFLSTKLCPDKESISDEHAKDIDKFAVKTWYRGN